jgi:hypothetical protein
MAMLTIVQPQARADIALETETGDLGKKGESNFSQGIQFDHDREGRTVFLLNQYEYAMTDNSEILIEPFFYQWTKLKDGTSFHGIGDLEITPSYKFIPETDICPGIVAAFKVKVPMASNRDIGTGKFDYYPYFIINKHIGEWDFNVNLGCNFFGQTAGDPHQLNQFIYDLSVQHPLTEKLEFIAEIFGNSKPAAGEKGTFAGAMALEYEFNKHFNVFLSVGYDTDHTFSVRPGFNIPF